MTTRPQLLGVTIAALLACSSCSPAVVATSTPVASESDLGLASPEASPSPAVSPSPSPASSRAPLPTASPSPAHCPGSDRTPNAPAGSAIPADSATWAGYAIYKTAPTVTCVEGSWVQPRVTCPATGHVAVDIWIGMDGIDSPSVGVNSSKTLEQIGTQADCRSGRVSNLAWHEVLPAESQSVPITSMRVAAGDRIWAMVTYASKAFTLRIRNVTTARSFSITQIVPGAARITAEWIVEAPSTGCPAKCTISGLPRFGIVTFTGAYAGTGSQRGSISDDTWWDGVLDMVRSGIERAATSGLTSAGTSFTVTWRHG